MKRILILYSVFILAIILLLGYQGCSELDKNAVLSPSTGIHPAGWATKSDINFHGKYILTNNKWNMNECKTCHGTDYLGGNTGKSCFTCHVSSSGPEDCRTCHGNEDHINPPAALNGDTSTASLGVGVHMTHLYNTRFSATVACQECHLEVGSFTDTNHLGNNPDGIAEITFGTLSRTTIGGGITPNPVWDRSTATCSNLYCHGTFVQGNQNATGNWINPNVDCGTCHGNQTTGNPTPQQNGVFTSPHFSFMTINSCYICHGSVINPQGVIIDKSKHVNGVVNY